MVKCDAQGSELSLYIDTATGTAGPPVYVFHEGVEGDLTFNDTDAEDEYNPRSGEAVFVEYTPGKTTLSIEGTQSTDMTYIGNAYLNDMGSVGEAKNILALTSPLDVEDGVGYQGYFWNFNKTLNGPNTGRSNQNFSLKPAACSLGPVRYVRTNASAGIEDWDHAGPLSLGLRAMVSVIEDNQTLEDFIKAIKAAEGIEFVYTDPSALHSILGNDIKKMGTYFHDLQKVVRRKKTRTRNKGTSFVRSFQLAEFHRETVLKALEGLTI
jgi:hypothetical protein